MTNAFSRRNMRRPSPAGVAQRRKSIPSSLQPGADVHAVKADPAALEVRLTWRMVGLAALIIAAAKPIPAP